MEINDYYALAALGILLLGVGSCIPTIVYICICFHKNNDEPRINKLSVLHVIPRRSSSLPSIDSQTSDKSTYNPKQDFEIVTFKQQSPTNVFI